MRPRSMHRIQYVPMPTSITSALHIPFDNSYSSLPAEFYARVNPTPVAAPRVIVVNEPLARLLGIDPEALRAEEGTQVLAGNSIAPGSVPLAQAYAGHQFGHFVPQLGDGRANLLGEVVALDGRRYDIQLKGAGPTPFSRRGDGRAALGPVLREYILSEAMAALGVPTTRALAAVATGDAVYRETMQPGAILTRVASSHLRVGTFQFFAAREDVSSLRTLANYAIARHYPDAAHAAQPVRAFLDGVIARQAALVAQWMLLGFIHGVMNTDNTSISGETIDYGPCAFMEAYDPAKVYSSIDHRGRYAYSNQPAAMHWNLCRLAECLLPLLAEDGATEAEAMEMAQESLAAFVPQYEEAFKTGMRRKLGLVTEREGDAALADDLLTCMAAGEADFTRTFRLLCDAAADRSATGAVAALFRTPGDYEAWSVRWHARLAQETSPVAERTAAMKAVNPAVIPRNHFVQAVIDAAVQRQDFAPFDALVEATSSPYADRTEAEPYLAPATPAQFVLQTFCGT